MNTLNVSFKMISEVMAEPLTTSEKLKFIHVIILSLSLCLIIKAINKTSFGSSLVKVGSTILMCFIEGSLTKKSLENVRYATKHDEKNKYFGISF